MRVAAPGDHRCVLHVAETMRGGVGSYLAEILEAQAARFGADNVWLLAPRSHLHQVPAHQAIRTVSFEDGDGRLVHCARLMSRLRHLVATHRFDVVHAHSAIAGVAVRTVLRDRRDRPPVIYCAHGWAFDRGPPSAENKAAAIAERMLSRWTRRIVCISEFDRTSALARGLPAERLVVIHNGIAAHRPQTDFVPTWPAGRLRVLFVGRFDRQKGLDLFLDAMAALGDRAFAFLVGDQVVSAGSKLKLSGNVAATGWLPRDRIEAYYETADIVVVPSRWEGFGLVALEAMRAGKAVVATRVGGLPEVVEDGVTGLLVAPESPQAIAAALGGVDPATLIRMGEAGRRRFLASFTADRMNQEIIRLYDGVWQG